MDQAFKNFFGGVAKYPSLKKKFYHDNLILPNDQFLLKGQKVHRPKLGWVRMQEP